jgi:hypothetical protein
MSSDYTGNGPTRFTEANALLAVQSHDTDTALEALSGLTESELISLENAAAKLGRLCFAIRRAETARTL